MWSSIRLFIVIQAIAWGLLACIGIVEYIHAQTSFEARMAISMDGKVTCSGRYTWSYCGTESLSSQERSDVIISRIVDRYRNVGYVFFFLGVLVYFCVLNYTRLISVRLPDKYFPLVIVLLSLGAIFVLYLYIQNLN